MYIRDPVRSVAWALQKALSNDLLGVDCPHASGIMRRANDGPSKRRPGAQECNVVLFGQVWCDDALGYARSGTSENVEADTVVIVGPAQDACVYVSTQLLYHVCNPNRRFFLDVASQCMAPPSMREHYEGRDDALVESLPFDVEMTLARLHAEVKAVEPARAVLVAELLQGYAARLAQMTSLR